MVTAVDHPRLRHLKNVIVFNVRGNRDLPNMCVLREPQGHANDRQAFGW